MNPIDKLIVALDVDSEDKAVRMVEKLKNDVRFFKVGLELFSSCGPKIVERIKETDCEVFLDLKFHDIPNTVSRTSASVTKLGAYMFNVHALGGFEMMKDAFEAARKEAETLKIERPKILAVTILTSMDSKNLHKVGVDDTADKAVLRLSGLARDAGLDGVVASPAETKAIRKKFGSDFLIVTPGVRPSWAVADDQKRIASPKEAVKNGADFIVVGRPITEAKDPVSAAKEILTEMEQ